MRLMKDRTIDLIYLVVILVIFAGTRVITYEWEKEIEMLKMEISKQEFEIEQLQHQKDIFQEIILRDKRKIKELLEEIEELKVIRARVTAYAPYDNQSGICSDGDPSVTATGTTPGQGTLAADFDKLPPGTKLDIPGYGLGIIEDTGSALRRGRGLRIDVFKETYEEAIEFGIQELDIVLKR